MRGRHLDVLGQAVLSKGAPTCNMKSEHFGKATSEGVPVDTGLLEKPCSILLSKNALTWKLHGNCQLFLLLKTIYGLFGIWMSDLTATSIPQEWKNGPAFGMPGIQVDRIHVLKFREVGNDA
ncbi:hypothetical protein AHAS_Ahas01G0003700 [Arachis hypogaea]